MILGIKELHKLVKEIKLVEGLCDREMNNPEGAGFDYGFLGVEERKTPTAKLIAKGKEACAADAEITGVVDETEDSFVFKPGKYYLIKTMEKVNLPTTLSGIIFPRTTMFRSGLGLFNGIVQPGYSGELSFGVCNLGQADIKVSFGARVVHITFQEVLGEGNQYRGQWQGGRVSTEGQETQV